MRCQRLDWRSTFARRSPLALASRPFGAAGLTARARPSIRAPSDTNKPVSFLSSSSETMEFHRRACPIEDDQGAGDVALERWPSSVSVREFHCHELVIILGRSRRLRSSGQTLALKASSSRQTYRGAPRASQAIGWLAGWLNDWPTGELAVASQPSGRASSRSQKQHSGLLAE